MKYKKAKKLVEESFSDDGMNVVFGWKFRFYPRFRKQMKQWGQETLESEYIKEEDLDFIDGDFEKAIKNLEKKGLIMLDDKKGVKITTEGIKTAEWLIKNDPFSKDIYKKLCEEDEA